MMATLPSGGDDPTTIDADDLQFPGNSATGCRAWSAEHDTKLAFDPGVPRMSEMTILEACLRNNGYRAPELNDLLMLQHRGFRSIQCLEAYSNVKSLFLECNGLSRIQGLSCLPQLRSLYLQQNCISVIENLGGLVHLQHLNLAHNTISHVSGLESLEQLERINLSSNKIIDVEGLAGLAARSSSLRSVDVSCNYLEDGDALVSFWPQALGNLECLYLHRNPCTRLIKDYRRRVVSTMRRLTWLDERKVPEVERVGANAWQAGGEDKEAEMKAKAYWWLDERSEKDQSFEDFRMASAAAAERARHRRESEREGDEERSQAQKEFDETCLLPDGWVAFPIPIGAELASALQAARDKPLARQGELRAKWESITGKLAPATAQAPAGPIVDFPEAPPATEQATPSTLAATEGVRAELLVGLSLLPDCTVGAGETFVWTSRRDHRLGRVVAEHRYNFQVAAVALTQELNHTLSASDCRARYRELTRPAFTPPSRGPACPEQAGNQLAVASPSSTTAVSSTSVAGCLIQRGARTEGDADHVTNHDAAASVDENAASAGGFEQWCQLQLARAPTDERREEMRGQLDSVQELAAQLVAGGGQGSFPNDATDALSDTSAGRETAEGSEFTDGLSTAGAPSAANQSCAWASSRDGSSRGRAATGQSESLFDLD